jgi:hypothetical protein
MEPTTTQKIVDELGSYPVEYGEKYQDGPSGFVGVAVAINFRRYSVAQVCLSGTRADSGTACDDWFNAPDLKPVD